jgi:ATP synthase protein I
VNEERDSRSWLSVGFAWAARITTLALEFTVPVVIGVGLDRWLGTSPGATLAGAILGFVLFMLHTLRFAKELPAGPGHGALRRQGTPARPEDDNPESP